MLGAASSTAGGRCRGEPHVLVTGGSGFLGRAVAQALPDAHALSSRELDLTDGAAVAEAIDEWRPDVVIHLAARVGGITANLARPADFLLDNLRMDANLLAALARHRPRHVLATLSTCMYPDEVDASLYPMTEELIEAGPPPGSNAAYASAKRTLWHGLQALHDQYGIPYTALVPSNLYGPGDHFDSEGSHFLAAAVHKLETARLAGEPSVAFFGTGKALRQYVFVEDLARLVAHLCQAGPLNDTLNVAPAGHHTIAELAAATAAAVGYQGAVTFTGDGPDGQFRKDVVSSKLAARVPVWPALETELSEGLQRTVDWYRRQRVAA